MKQKIVASSTLSSFCERKKKNGFLLQIHGELKPEPQELSNQTLDYMLYINMVRLNGRLDHLNTV